MKKIRVFFNRKEGPWAVLKTVEGKEILVPQKFVEDWQEGDMLELVINSLNFDFEKSQENFSQNIENSSNLKSDNLQTKEEEKYQKIARAILEEIINPEKEER
jgi:hypothetical protein